MFISNMKKKDIPIYIQRRYSDIENKFLNLVDKVDFTEFEDEDDFHSFVVHELSDMLSVDLDSYNFIYEYLDDIMINPIKKVWKNRKKITRQK